MAKKIDSTMQIVKSVSGQVYLSTIVGKNDSCKWIALAFSNLGSVVNDLGHLVLAGYINNSARFLANGEEMRVTSADLNIIYIYIYSQAERRVA